MYRLIIDTSTERGVVAIAQGLHLCFTKELPFGLLNSRHLLSTIKVGFQSLKITARDLQYVAVGVGPGSFTGIRVGVAAAMGIAAYDKLPLISFSSLEGFISTEEGKFASVIDAKMNLVYFLLQERRAGEIVSGGLVELVHKDDLKMKCQRLVGPVFDPVIFKEFNTVECFPHCAHLSQLCEKKFESSQFSRNGNVKLMYVREI